MRKQSAPPFSGACASSRRISSARRRVPPSASANLRARAEQLVGDTAREEALIAEARQILAELASEIEALATADVEAGDTERSRYARRLEAAQETVREAEAGLAELTTKVAEHRARKRSRRSQPGRAASDDRQAHAAARRVARRRRARFPDALRTLKNCSRLPRRASSSPTRSCALKDRRSPPRTAPAACSTPPTQRAGKATHRACALPHCAPSVRRW